MNDAPKPIAPTEDEAAWINNSNNPEHAALLWRYAAMVNSLDMSWLDGCIGTNATYSSQSVFQVLEGSDRIRDYQSGKFEALKKSGNSSLVRATLAELPDAGSESACVAIYQAQSEFDQSAWNTPTCCMTLQCLQGEITGFLMVVVVQSPASAKVSGLFPMGLPPPRPRPALRDASSYREMCFLLCLLDGECPIDLTARHQVSLAMQQYSGAQYREIICSYMSPEEHSEIIQLNFFGFPSLALMLRGQVLYRHTGIIGTENLNNELKTAFFSNR